MLERLPGLRIIEHPLERVVHTQAFPDLLHGASVIPLIRRRCLLGAEDQRLQRLEVRQSLVALDVPEDDVEERQRRS